MKPMTKESASVATSIPIRDGYDADLVLFDYDALRDTATYDRPNSITEGIKGVYVGGKLVYDGKAFTGAAPGRMIRHNG